MCKQITSRPAPIAVSPLHTAAAFVVVALPAVQQKPIAAAVQQPKKRVSFHNVVDVYVIDRLDPFAVRDLFYRSDDFRRFRSDICLEKLETKACETSLVTAVFRAILTNIGVQSSKQLTTPTRTLQLQQQQQSRRPRSSPESLLRELSFAV